MPADQHARAAPKPKPADRRHPRTATAEPERLARVVRLAIDDLTRPGGGDWKLTKPPKYMNKDKTKIDIFDGRRVLSVFYGKGSGTSNMPGVGGCAISASPWGDEPVDSAVMSFQVYFAPGWDFSKGGKIGGFHVGHGKASGYRHSDTASSHRIMWQRDGGAISYIYPPSNLAQADPRLRPEGCGIGYFHDAFPAGTLKVGRWNTVRIGVKVNTFDAHGAPRPDGVALLEVNGEERRLENVRWSRSPDLKISTFELGTFFGGPDPAVRDCTAHYATFRWEPWP